MTRDRLRWLISDLDQLPESQRGALVMRELAGLDFTEIGAALDTSAAVARQTLYEARLGLRKMDEGRAMSCATVTKVLSDGDGRVGRRRDVRAHLRTCPSCRRFREEIGGRERDLAALAPLPAVATAGLLQGLLGGHGAGGGGLAGALGGGGAKTLGTSAALKGAATVAVVAAIGVGGADRGGLVDVVPDGGSQASRPEQARGRKPLRGWSGPGFGSTCGRRRGRVGGGNQGLGSPCRQVRPGIRCRRRPEPARRVQPALPPAWQGPRKAAPERLHAWSANRRRPQSRRPRARSQAAPRAPGQAATPAAPLEFQPRKRNLAVALARKTRLRSGAAGEGEQTCRRWQRSLLRIGHPARARRPLWEWA